MHETSVHGYGSWYTSPGEGIAMKYGYGPRRRPAIDEGIFCRGRSCNNAIVTGPTHCCHRSQQTWQHQQLMPYCVPQ